MILYAFRVNYHKTGSWEKKMLLAYPTSTKILWEKFVPHKLLQGMFQEVGRKGEGGQKSNFIINWMCMTADIIHTQLRRGWCNAVPPKPLLPAARLWHEAVRCWLWEEHPKKSSRSGLQLPLLYWSVLTREFRNSNHCFYCVVFYSTDRFSLCLSLTKSIQNLLKGFSYVPDPCCPAQEHQLQPTSYCSIYKRFPGSTPSSL